MTIDRLSLLVGKPRGFSVLDDGSGRNRPEPPKAKPPARTQGFL